MTHSLIELGIELQRPNQPGEHRAPCPWCAKGPRDDALAVLVEPHGGAAWFCHRCEAKGGTGQERHAAPRLRRQERHTERREILSDRGRALWEASRPIEHGTVAAAYLAHRGCALPPEDGHLRWHPEMPYHVQGQREPIHVGPALVGLVTDVETATPIGLHRTWITAIGKADLGEHKPRKLLWKHRSDGVVRLWPSEAVTVGLTLAEGIETALAGASAGLVPVWSTVSAGNLARLPVLPGLEGITVLVDHDRPNPRTGKRAGHEAARQLIERYVEAGFDPERDIAIVLPCGEGLDVADLVGSAS